MKFVKWTFGGPKLRNLPQLSKAQFNKVIRLVCIYVIGF